MIPYLKPFHELLKANTNAENVAQNSLLSCEERNSSLP